ncbi:hypothetical protein BO94DRAFT_545848 [Aspergillus sclerotioniger CBS 115572]|uniref:Uncharacterized protein n=1 Tax=Aspergillus sclerotioniger CBS 115572 TaxID=1450535 RepID=A0A317WQT4_9EURO|nr:hypothetical protein BO94DRAFT_545848 [Aspergillus sclerotioniger CBS 115572]PWY88766.1 hypothetical protein BO94DRAFT_545848 [Aspergillus sclerotioniger CBS 115572]
MDDMDGMDGMDGIDDLAALSDTMVYQQVLTVFSPVIPASIRRRLPSLYCSMHRLVRSDVKSSAKAPSAGDSRNGSMRSMRLSSDNSGLKYVRPLPDIPPESPFQRPSTASSASNGRDLYASSVFEGQGYTEASSLAGSRPDDVFTPVNSKYEVDSGLRWNRIVPAIGLLQNATREAQQHQCDNRLARLLYINALGYLLDGLPADMTDDEVRTIQHNLPADVREALPAPVKTGTPAGDRHPPYPPERSYLHRLLASSIIKFFLLVQFFMPHVKVLMRIMYEYERSHQITERAITTAHSLGRGGVNLGSAILNFNEGKVGATLSNLAAWWVEGIAGGIHEGMGEGMIMMGLIRPNAEMEGASMQASQR